MVKKHHNKSKYISGLVIKLGIVLALIVISGFAFQRFDITEEKRHSLTDASKELLEELEDVVFVKVYLKGDYPAEFKRLERSIREKLDEMIVYAGENLQYEFINPSEAPDQETRNKVYKKLTEDGLQYTSLLIETQDGATEKIIFPGAMVSYKQKNMPLQILKGGFRTPDAVAINNSINNLEYEFTHIIRKIQEEDVPNIAFLVGHGELPEPFVADITRELSDSYYVDFLQLDGQINRLFNKLGDGQLWKNRFDMIIVADPDSSFSDRDKFLLDQFVMRGGKMIWLIDPLHSSRDSLRGNMQFLATSKDLGIEDQLFKYGVRLNKNLVIDSECGQIDVLTGYIGEQPKIEIFDWIFNPTAISRSGHPIVNNIEKVNLDFVSSIDTLNRPGVKQSVLLTSSAYSRTNKVPVRVNVNAVRQNVDFINNNDPFQPIAVLLEGQFESAYANRVSPFYKQQEGIFKIEEKSKSTSMLVVADGDVCKNIFDWRNGVVYPLNYDKYKKAEIYGNKEFMLNAVNYMLDESSLISLRTRSIKLRQMNKEMLSSKRTQIQAANVGIPLMIVIFFGLVNFVLRKKKYAK